eukprot:scaffold3165_cov380-Prasinococcus_capsulatus_cf.AAC.2
MRHHAVRPQVWRENQPRVEEYVERMRKGGFAGVDVQEHDYSFEIRAGRWYAMVEGRFWSTFTHFTDAELAAGLTELRARCGAGRARALTRRMVTAVSFRALQVRRGGQPDHLHRSPALCRGYQEPVTGPDQRRRFFRAQGASLHEDSTCNRVGDSAPESRNSVYWMPSAIVVNDKFRCNAPGSAAAGAQAGVAFTRLASH